MSSSDDTPFESRKKEYSLKPKSVAMREYRQRNPEKQKVTRKRQYHRRRPKFQKKYREKRAQVIAAYGGRCVCCGEDNLCFLTIDHVKNDGAVQRKKFKKSKIASDLYRYLIRNGLPQDGYQVLCYNCNCAKQHDPFGHRAAHTKASSIDGLGDLPNGEFYMPLPMRRNKEDNDFPLFDD